MASHWLLWLLSSYLVLLGAVCYGSVCYSYGGSYSYYCKHGCCDRYSYYTGYQDFCCSGSDQALYIGLGVAAAVIVLTVIGFVVFFTFSQQQKKKNVTVRPSNTQTAAAPVQVGTTVHQSNPSTSVTNKQQPAPPPPQQLPPPHQQYPPPPQQYPPPPEQYPPPMPYPPPYQQAVGTSNPVYPPPPPSYPYEVGTGAGPGAGPY